MLKRFRLNFLPSLIVIAVTIGGGGVLLGHPSEQVGIATAAAVAVIDATYIAGAWGLRREEARGVAAVAAERVRSTGRPPAAAAPPPEGAMAMLRELGGMVGLDVDDLADELVADGVMTEEMIDEARAAEETAPGVPRLPARPRYPRPWEPVSEAAPHVFRGGPSTPDKHREGRILSGSPDVPPGAQPAPEIPPPAPPP